MFMQRAAASARAAYAHSILLVSRNSRMPLGEQLSNMTRCALLYTNSATNVNSASTAVGRSKKTPAARANTPLCRKNVKQCRDHCASMSDPESGAVAVCAMQRARSETVSRGNTVFGRGAVKIG